MHPQTHCGYQVAIKGRYNDNPLFCSSVCSVATIFRIISFFFFFLSLFIFQLISLQILKKVVEVQQQQATQSTSLSSWCLFSSFWACWGWSSATCWRGRATGAPLRPMMGRRGSVRRKKRILSWAEVRQSELKREGVEANSKNTHV